MGEGWDVAISLSRGEAAKSNGILMALTHLVGGLVAIVYVPRNIGNNHIFIFPDIYIYIYWLIYICIYICIYIYIGLLIIPIDFHIFQRGGLTTNQLNICRAKPQHFIHQVVKEWDHVVYKWGWSDTYYTIRGMNIHRSQLFGCEQQGRKTQRKMNGEETGQFARVCRLWPDFLGLEGHPGMFPTARNSMLWEAI